ncbi:MAG: N-acetylglucosamine kinase [Oceanospirillaceae bacterium]|jgi:N-acetylglucosamine kinase
MYYGIDIGGTKIELAAFDQDFQLIKQRRVATPTQDYQVFLNTVQAMVLEFDKALNCEGAVGIGFPGIRDLNDGTFVCVNISCVTGKLLDQDLTHLLKRRVIIENDCKCFALSEAVLGSAKGYQHVFGAIIGTGAGGGLVTKGHLSAGAHGIAGEWGHIGINAYIVDKYQLPVWGCACGLSGCAEQYISGSGLQNLYRYSSKTLTKNESLNGQEIMKLVENQDALALEVFEMYVDILSSSLATIQLSYDTDAIVLGGGMSNVAALYEKLPGYIAQHMFERAQVPAILAPEFGDSSGVRGAALLHFDL